MNNKNKSNPNENSRQYALDLLAGIYDCEQAQVCFEYGEKKGLLETIIAPKSREARIIRDFMGEGQGFMYVGTVRVEGNIFHFLKDEDYVSECVDATQPCHYMPRLPFLEVCGNGRLKIIGDEDISKTLGCIRLH